MADEEKEESKSSGGLLPIINMVLLVLVLGVGSFVAWKMIQMDQPAEVTDVAPSETPETQLPEAEVEDPEAVPVLMDIDNITINLADNNRFLRTKIKLELRSEEDRTLLSSDIGMAKIKDMIGIVLSGKTFDEIRTPSGKYNLKEELRSRINKLFPGKKPVKALYFTDFVSQ